MPQNYFKVFPLRIVLKAFLLIRVIVDRFQITTGDF